MRPYHLSPRELEVLQSMCYGDSNKLIAKRLGMAVGTVKHDAKQIFLKMNVGSRLEAVVKAFREHLVQEESVA